MMKKFKKICVFIIIGAMLLLCPGAFVLPTAVRTAANDFHHTMPEKITEPFGEELITEYPLRNWEKLLSTYAVSEEISNENFEKFNNTYPNALLMRDKKIGNRTATVITSKYADTPITATYTSPDITLNANSYYTLSVEYFIPTGSADAYFYLDGTVIPLAANNDWLTSTYFIATDSLQSSTCQAKLGIGCGPDNQPACGTVYFANCTLTAISASRYASEIAALKNDRERVIDQHSADFDLDNQLTYTNTDFFPYQELNAYANNQTTLSEVPGLLNFADNIQLYTKDGASNGSVMLLKARNATASLELNATFSPALNEVYLFQFYTLAAADNGNFYFRIHQEFPDDDDREPMDDYLSIETVSYPYYNGWQLNSIFLIGNRFDDGVKLSFSYTLGNIEDDIMVPTTGWALIDSTALQITKVSNEYAANNANSGKVIQTISLNNSTNDNGVANGQFNTGTATIWGTDSYPYPLKLSSSDWTTNDTTNNGIVNTNRWQNIAATFPGKTPSSKGLDNNVFMLRNYSSAKANTLTSPALSLIIDTTTYVYFEAYATRTAPLLAEIILDGTTVLGQIEIKDDAWQRYEFSIREAEFHTEHTYNLRFTLKAADAVAYVDNVRANTTRSSLYRADGEPQAIDLGQPLTFPKLWQRDSDDGNLLVDYDTTDEILTLANNSPKKVTATYQLPFAVVDNNYYCFSFTAIGKNAVVELTGFEGSLKVTEPADGKAVTYYFYFQGPEDVVQTQINITLGSLNEKETEFEDGYLKISALTYDDLEEAEYLAAQAKGNSDTCRFITIAQAKDTDDEDKGGFDFARNWWYLVPTLITALAIVLALVSYFLRRLKFEKHITRKETSYARDVQLLDGKKRKKIVAERSAKVDNKKGETESH